MSSAKFASITSSLLARKGDATPSLATLPVRPSAFGDIPPPFPPPPPPFKKECSEPPQEPVAQPASATMPPRGAPADRPRRIVITLTAEEFEKLGIAAIKKDKTRHQIVRGALDAYFRQLASELPRACNCMAKRDCCS